MEPRPGCCLSRYSARVGDRKDQLLEYNHYPDRIPAGSWLIVLDEKPKPEDCGFIDKLRTPGSFRSRWVGERVRNAKISRSIQSFKS
jgi:hypothetical protein